MDSSIHHLIHREQYRVVLEHASFVRQGGRLFVIGRTPEYSAHNLEWSIKLQSGVPWDAVLHYMIFDSYEDYITRCRSWNPSWWKRLFGY